MTIAPPGTCKLIGCPHWGRHQPHSLPVRIGAGSWADYQPDTCLGFPLVEVVSAARTLRARCSIRSLSWTVAVEGPISPVFLAQLVEDHRLDCRNRQAHP